GAGYGKVLSVLGDGWRAVGAEVAELQVSAAQQNDREYIATHAFADVLGRPYRIVEWQDSLYGCASAARAEPKWLGHRAGYCNPAADQLVRRLVVTVDEASLTDLQVQ